MPTKPYPDEFRVRALRLFDEVLPDCVSQAEAFRRVSSRLGVSREALRRWRHQGLIDQGSSPGISTSENAEIKRLKRENAELRRANEILRTASAFFAAEPGRPATK